ncbi:MAG: hypothetical protein ACYC3I_17960 [Gemmataceae bacterium]
MIDGNGVRQKRPVTYQVLLFDVKTNKFMALPGLPPQAGVSHILFALDSLPEEVRASVPRLLDKEKQIKLSRDRLLAVDNSAP